jgi:GTP-binding protein YchF
MGFRCGIVGLPNVGKSTLFNALTETAAAQAANYPFCTIEPNVGNVAVPDPRLQQLATIAGSQKIIETQLGFVDIAGLVRGASKGEGLGNQFLGNIREVDAIVHVLRCFTETDVTHVEGKVDPIADAETVETELMLSDLESLEKRVPAAAKKATQGDKEAKIAASVLGQALDLLRDGKPARLTVPKDEDEARVFAQAQLLTAKPVLYVCNVDEGDAAHGNALSAKVFEKARSEGAQAGRLGGDRGGDRDDGAGRAWRVPRRTGPRRDRARARDHRRLFAAAVADLLHRRAQGNARLDDACRRDRADGGGRDPQRFRERLHPRRDDRVRRFHRARR